ncbi:contractile injection system protein, VgrG/Pvc8 family, partial [Sulfurimonas sp.]
MSANILNSHIHQRVTARVKLIEYAKKSIIDTGSYSIYKLQGESEVLRGYNYEVVFISDENIDVEDIVDTQVEIQLRDEINPLDNKKIYGHIVEAQEYVSVAKKRLYKIRVTSPLYYLGLNRRYEIYQEKSISDIISEIFTKYNGLLNIQLDVKVDPQSLPKRETTTQYNQSDLEFVQMLCEEEGVTLLYGQDANEPYTICLCELNEHVKHINESIEATMLHSKQFTSSTVVQDYYDREKPSLEYGITKSEALVGSMSDNEATTQLRQEIKQHTLRDKLEKLDESLYKDLKRYTTIDAQRGSSQGVRVYAKSQSLKIGDGISLNLHDPKILKNSAVIILKVNYKAEFPNALQEYAQADANQEAQYSVEFEAIP